MGKAPADQFYYADFDRDTRSCTLRARGLWITLLGYLWFRGGVDTLSIDDWARVAGCPPEEFCDALNELGEKDIPQVSTAVDNDVDKMLVDNWMNTPVTLGNNSVTVMSRRQYRMSKARLGNRLRVQKHRRNAAGNQNVMVPSSSSSSKEKTLVGVDEGDKSGPNSQRRRTPECRWFPPGQARQCQLPGSVNSGVRARCRWHHFVDETMGLTEAPTFVQFFMWVTERREDGRMDQPEHHEI